MSKTGKKSKGRPKNNISRKTIIKELYNELPDDLLKEILDNWLEKSKNSNDNKTQEILKKIVKNSSLSLRKLELIFGISKSHIQRIKNGWEKKYRINNIRNNVEKIILNIYWELNGVRGRKPIAAWLELNYGIKLSDRSIGRILSKNGLKSTIRVKNSGRCKELKDTRTIIPDLVQRDYDNLFHKQTILATDVTYIESPGDLKNQSYVFFSVVINHSNKKIEGFKLSKNNNTNLGIDTIINIEIDNDVILHSDHGTIYTSFDFIDLIKEKGWKQSMGRVGNSLDNRVEEHFFGTLKTEFINKLNIKKLTFDELEIKIVEWIEYYNSIRIQEKLNWKAPNLVQ